MGETVWYYGNAGRQFGPTTLEQLRTLFSQGRLQPTDLVWREGMTNWIPASGVAELAASRVGPPPLPVLPLEYVSFSTSMPETDRDRTMRWLLPVGRSGLAIAAGYLGLLSVFLVFAPFAIAISIIAIKDLRQRPNLHGMGRAIFGLVMGALGSAALLVVIVAIAAS